MIDRVSKIHTRENMRLRRKLTKENKKSLAIMDENTHLRRELRKNEIDNSIFLGKLFPLASMETWFADFRFCATWLDSSFRRSIFGSLLRAKDFYSRDYQESLKSLRRNRLRFLQGSVVGVPGSSAGSMSDVSLARFWKIYWFEHGLNWNKEHFEWQIKRRIGNFISWF